MKADHEEAREILLRQFPVGSDPQVAVEWLEGQGFSCAPAVTRRNPRIDYNARPPGSDPVGTTFGAPRGAGVEPAKIMQVLCVERWLCGPVGTWYVTILVDDGSRVYDIGASWDDAKDLP